MRLRFIRGVLSGEQPLQAVMLTIATQMLVTLLNVATGVITARLLGPVGRGEFAAATLWPQFLSGIAVLGLPSALVFYVRQNPSERATAVTAGLLLALVTGLAATIAGFAMVAGAMTHYGRREVLLGWFCAAWTGPYLLTIVLRQVATSWGRFRSFNISSYLPPLLYILLLGPVSVLIPLTPKVAVECVMVPSGIVACWMLYDLCRVWRPSRHGLGKWLRLIATYAVQAAPGDLVTGVLASLDRIMLVVLLAPEMLGLYSVAFSLSRLLLVLQVVASAVLFPQMAGHDPPGAKQLHDIAFRLVLYVSVMAALVAVIFGRAALTLVYGADFGSAAPVLSVLMAEAGFACAAQVTSQLFLAVHRPAWVSAAQGISLVVAVLGLFILVPRTDAAGGAVGAAIALLVASMIRLAVLLPGIPWHLHLEPPRLHLTWGDFLFFRSRIL
jgi:O-antigen/teichoic acid export membrane protein